MSRIRSRNTKPEMRVRSALHRMGFRFRVHRSDLPGRPDVVLPKFRLALFVHGCFWHCHQNCPDGHVPKSNAEYWATKLKRNTMRHVDNVAALRKLGWRSAVLWECETERADYLVLRLQKLISRLRVRSMGEGDQRGARKMVVDAKNSTQSRQSLLRRRRS